MTQARRSFAPVVLGILLTMGLLAVIGYAASKRRGAQAETPPDITWVAPSNGDVVDTPLVIHFSSSRRLAAGQGGWGDGRFHLHAWINGIEHMPAAAAIRATAGGLYEWHLAATLPAEAQLYLGWADPSHRRIKTGMTTPISIRVAQD